jgi:hypothetical protein
MSAPTDRDVKRLFAASGNRCAFPKCNLHIAIGTELIGEICHIRGRRPNSPRHDPQQTDSDRHAFENLILLCANHHKVIDDDEVSYPVARLQKIKADHEAKQLGLLPGEHSNEVVRLLIDQSVSSFGQIGGIAAHSVHAGVINFHSSNSPETDPDRAAAVKVLWNTLVGLNSVFLDVIFIDNILLASELDDCFRGKSNNAFFDTIQRYQNIDYVPGLMRSQMPIEAERFRILISPRLWLLYGVGLSVYGRTAMLLTLSFKQRKLNNWRDDELLIGNLLSVFPQSLINEWKQMQIGGLRQIAASIDDAFLEEGRKTN